jgi:hypothetical protein
MSKHIKRYEEVKDYQKQRRMGIKQNVDSIKSLELRNWL